MDGGVNISDLILPWLACLLGDTFTDQPAPFSFAVPLHAVVIVRPVSCGYLVIAEAFLLGVPSAFRAFLGVPRSVKL